MTPYSHEFRHQLFTATALGSVVVLALVGAGAGYTASQVTLSEIQTVYTYSDGYHFLVYAIGSQGTAFSGASLVLWINSSATFQPPIAVERGATDASGLASFFFAIPNGSYLYSVLAIGAGIQTETGGQTNFNSNLSSGTGVLLDPVSLGTWATDRAVSVTALNATGQAPVGYQIRYIVGSGAYFPFIGVTPENATTLFTTLSGFQTNAPWNVSFAAPSITWVEFEAFTPSGASAGVVILSATELLTTGVSSAGASAVSSLSAAQTLVALLGLVLGYARYGKDRSMRTVESVLWRPVTREGLFVVRWASVVIPLGGGLALLLGLTDLWMTSVLSAGIPLGALLALFGVLLAEGMAMAGLLMLGSHLLRSRGGVIGLGVGLFILFGVFFTIFVALVAFGTGATDPAQVLVNAAYLNPMQLMGPATAVIVPQAASNSSGMGLAVPLNLSTTVTANAGVVAAVVSAWFAVPTLVAFVLARYRE